MIKLYPKFFLFLLITSGISLPSIAQHEHHNMSGQGMDMDTTKTVWRMPPMNMEMPMLPGMHNELPPVEPFLAGIGLDKEDIPYAKPREILELADGDTVALQASIVRRNLEGKDYVMYGYNGQYPGPLLKAPQNSTVMVEFNNQIELPTTVHWHGLRHDYRFDGTMFAQDPVQVGESFTYELFFRDAGVYWYHPHVLEYIQQDLGLYGNMLVEPPEEDYYSPVNREEMVILDDILIDDQGLIPWGESSPSHALMGRFGNVMLVNGKTDYELSVDKNEVLRFFITNVANTRTFNMVFEGAKVKVVGSDISKFEEEVYTENVPIAVAERYIVEVLYEEPGTYPILNSIQAINHFRGEFYPHQDTLGMVTVSEDEVETSYTEAFNTLRVNEDVKTDIAEFEEYFDKPVDKELELTVAVQNLPIPIMQSMELDTAYVPHLEWNDTMPMMNWLSTGKQVEWILHDPATGKKNMDIYWDFKKGDIVKLRIFNNPDTFHPMNHPFHIHGQRHLVLNIDGVENPNMVWKDTSIIPVGSTVDLLIEMSNPGKWMMHCHIGEHLDAGMMLGFEVGE